MSNTYEVFINNEIKPREVVCYKYFTQNSWINFVDDKNVVVDTFQEYTVQRIKLKR